jgi:hypothetical protein
LIEVSYVPDEEDRPVIVMRFRDNTRDQDSAILGFSSTGLRELHARLGGFIQELERAA